MASALDGVGVRRRKRASAHAQCASHTSARLIPLGSGDMQHAMRTLVLGGARSGKSRRAQTLAEGAVEAGRASRLVYVATAEPLDEDMAARIARHRSERDERWRTLEAPLELPEAITRSATPASLVLVDCLTLWLSNLMHAGREIESETARLLAALAGAGGPVILVSNEVGLGLVPETPLGRAFRDHQGRLNQAAASACERVEFVAAGLPLTLKG